MPSSFLKRHRTICSVLVEIKETAKNEKITTLCDEAMTYAKAMSQKLVEYKEEKMKNVSS
jgi:hypothetical protein